MRLAKKTVKIPAADAYGEYNRRFRSSRFEVPQRRSVCPLAGRCTQAPWDPSRRRSFLVDSEECVFDMNHELAGKRPHVRD